MLLQRDVRRGAAVSFLLFGGSLAGCVYRQPTPRVADPPHVATAGFSIQTPVDRIVANPAGKAVLDRDMPGFTTNRGYFLVSDMSLVQIAMISQGRLTTAKLDQVQADLASIPVASPK